MNKPPPNYDSNLVAQFLHAYQDRGMVKWNGFYLSDHTKRLEQESKAEIEAESREFAEEMTLDEINAILEKAYSKGLTVSAQLNATDLANQVPPSIVGKITGQYEGGILIGEQKVPLHLLRALTVEEQE